MICNEHVGLVKTWLPARYGGPKAWLDQLVDRALVLVDSFATRLNTTLFRKNFSIKYQVPMSVKSCTKRAHGALLIMNCWNKS